MTTQNGTTIASTEQVLVAVDAETPHDTDKKPAAAPTASDVWMAAKI